MDYRDGWKEWESGKNAVSETTWWMTKFWLIIKIIIGQMKRSFFQAAVVSILLYGWTTWSLTKRMEKKLDGNYTRMLRAILNKSWRQHPTKQRLYSHLSPVTRTINRRTRYAGHCWRSRDELVSDVLLWIPSQGRAKARTYIQKLCADTGCSSEDLPKSNGREGGVARGPEISVLIEWHDDYNHEYLHFLGSTSTGSLA